MPAVTSSIEIPGADVDLVWDVVSDSARFPDLAEHVKGVTWRNSGEAEWLVGLNGSTVSWIQRESARPPRWLDFEQVDGDLDRLRGRWSLHGQTFGVRLSLKIEFELGVDGLAPLLDPIWEQSFQAHANALVRAVERAVSSRLGEERPA